MSILNNIAELKHKLSNLHGADLELAKQFVKCAEFADFRFTKGQNIEVMRLLGQDTDTNRDKKGINTHKNSKQTPI